jgi:sigma-B regulation protein RsbU (phosphoserine phosphatase)
VIDGAEWRREKCGATKAGRGAPVDLEDEDRSFVDDRREHERLQLALEAGKLGTWTWDLATGVTVWDERLEAMNGMAPGTFGGTFEHWKAAIHPDDRAEAVRRVERALAAPGPYVLLHRSEWPDGSLHWLECRGRVLTDDTGEPIGTIGVALDVTGREVHQAALARRIAEDHQLVQSVQRALLPVRMPAVEGVEFAARYEASRGSAIGGDWYAFVPLRGGRLGVAIGDVAGHGLSAVAEMAHIRFSLRSLSYLHEDPTQVLAELSELVQVFSPDTMITALYGTLDPRSGCFEYALAGHFPPLVCGPDACELVDVQADPPLGLGKTYARHLLTLHPDQTLLAFTDGILERRTEPISESLARLTDTATPGPRAPDELCAHLMREMLADLPNDDDAAVVAVRITH